MIQNIGLARLMSIELEMIVKKKKKKKKKKKTEKENEFVNLLINLYLSFSDYVEK